MEQKEKETNVQQLFRRTTCNDVRVGFAVIRLTTLIQFPALMLLFARMTFLLVVLSCCRFGDFVFFFFFDYSNIFAWKFVMSMKYRESDNLREIFAKRLSYAM